jgi:hypothetical protein
MRRLKRRAQVVLWALILGLVLPGAAMANAEDDVTIQVNGQALQAKQHFTSAGKSYVDVASFLEAVGIAYKLNEAEQTVSVRGSNVAVVNRDGVWVAKVTELAEAAGASRVNWNGLSQTVDVVFDSELIVYGDVVAAELCIPQNRFTAGQSMVFRMTAKNPLTGELAEDAKLQVHLSTGEVLDMHLCEHPPGVPNAERFWSVRYDVTEDTPTGTLNYYVTAETETLKGQFQPFNILPSLLTIVAGDEAPADGGAAAE